MTTDLVITSVEEVAIRYKVTASDFKHLIRYYLRKYFANFTLQRIAKLTDCLSHQTVMHSLLQAESPTLKFIRKEIEETIMDANLNQKRLSQLVRDMRKAQRDYFATRSPEALKNSKRLETEVDKMLANENQTSLPLVR